METLTAISGRISDSSNFTDSVFGTPNPIVFNGTEWVSGHIIINVHVTVMDMQCVHVLQ